ncbi:MAG: AraC family transcriptional regulator [Candidatus Kapabacteria bacterium]|nr:AraC family transcriptional regulator [Candidatus Kapabacteria bacterium]
MNIVSIFHLLGAAQGLFLALTMLFWRRGNRRANLLVSAIFLLMALALWNSFLVTSGYYKTITFSIRWYDVARLMTGPLIYFYVREMTAKPLMMRDIVHCLPTLLYGAFLIPFFMSGSEEKVRFVEHTLQGHSLDYLRFGIARSFYNLAYLIVSLFLLRTYSRRIREVFASLESVNLLWLWLMVWGTTLLTALVVIGNIGTLWGLYNPTQINFSLAVLAFLWVYGLAFYALRSNVINSSELRSLLAETAPTTAEPRISLFSIRGAHSGVFSSYAQPNGNGNINDNGSINGSENNNNGNGYAALQETGAAANDTALQQNRKASSAPEIHAEALRRCMEEQKPFLDNQLTVQKFAQVSSVPAHRVSEILNKELGVTFFDFVNQYRVEEWKRRIIDASPSATVQEIAYQVGFHSKSSFYSAFKKFTGQTPSEYRSAISA